VFLLDEPTSGLDPKARAALVRLLSGMNRTMLIATHDLEAAAEIVDRVIVLKQSVVMEGPMRDVVMAGEVLDQAGLEMPPVSKLLSELEGKGYSVGDLPVTLDQAVAELTKVIDRERRRARRHVRGPDESEDERNGDMPREF
jgi:ABC-type multidrug transport system ATPase subunit